MFLGKQVSRINSLLRLKNSCLCTSKCTFLTTPVKHAAEAGSSSLQVLTEGQKQQASVLLFLAILYSVIVNEFFPAPEKYSRNRITTCVSTFGSDALRKVRSGCPWEQVGGERRTLRFYFVSHSVFVSDVPW